MELSLNEFEKIGGTIIDIRDKYKYDKNHLSTAIYIPFYQLIVYPSRYLEKNTNYLLVCDYGIKSKETCKLLNKDGYHTYSLKGGYKL